MDQQQESEAVSQNREKSNLNNAEDIYQDSDDESYNSVSEEPITPNQLPKRNGGIHSVYEAPSLHQSHRLPATLKMKKPGDRSAKMSIK